MNPRVLRIVLVSWFLMFLAWLPFEDTSIMFSTLLALDLCIWLALRFWPTWVLLDPAVAVLASGAWLAAIPALGVALMAFKSGLHGHGFADFTASQTLTLLVAVPICFIVGAVLGGLLQAVNRKT